MIEERIFQKQQQQTNKQTSKEKHCIQYIQCKIQAGCHLNEVKPVVVLIRLFHAALISLPRILKKAAKSYQNCQMNFYVYGLFPISYKIKYSWSMAWGMEGWHLSISKGLGGGQATYRKPESHTETCSNCKQQRVLQKGYDRAWGYRHLS